MKDFWTKAALGAAAILCAGATQAMTNIDFENVYTSNAPFAPLLSDWDYVDRKSVV